MENLKTLKELQPLIIEWAKEKNILQLENAPKQRLKLLEECGELASAILKNDVKLQKDAIGDIFVVITIFNEQVKERSGGFSDNQELLIENCKKENSVDIITSLISSSKKMGGNFDSGWNMCFQYLKMVCYNLGLDLTECANIAWNEIKDRKGNTVNGTFIKDEEHRDGGQSIEIPKNK